MKIALIEDERKLSDSLKEGLEAEGYFVTPFYDGLSGEEGLRTTAFDAVLLDLMLPEKNGFDVCRSVRGAGLNMPIIVLTARDNVDDRILALDGGADDFVAKPFSFEELLARLRALSRRAGRTSDKKISTGEVTIDSAAHRAFRNAVEIPLTHTEYLLLEFLMRNAGQAKTREDIFFYIWNRKDDEFGNVVDVHIRNLRKKIDDDYDSKIIRTIRSVGYAAQG